LEEIEGLEKLSVIEVLVLLPPRLYVVWRACFIGCEPFRSFVGGYKESMDVAGDTPSIKD
jgi:hypothetical protein